MTIFYIPNSTQYLNLTTTFLSINYQQIRSLMRQNQESELKIKCDSISRD